MQNPLKKTANALKSFLKQGVTPEKLSLALALGIIIGLFPVIGITSILCAAVAMAFRLNMAVIQLANYTIYPLQLIVIIPLFKITNQIFHVTTFDLNFQNVIALFKTDTMAALGSFGNIILYSSLLWLAVAIPATILIYLVSHRYLKRIKIKV